MSGSSVLLLCAGDGTRWGEYLRVPKQLIPFNGEPLLSRTLRLLGELGYKSEIASVSWDSRLHIRGTVSFIPQAYRWTVETLLATRPLWRERTIVLLGDVYFTPRALRRILDYTNPIGFFGRPWPSAYTGCDHGEIFALSFSADGAEKLVRGGTHALLAVKRGAWGNFWDLYHSMTGLELGSSRTESRLFDIVDDLTNDFDTPREYLRVSKRYQWASSPRPIVRLLAWIWLVALAPRHWAGRLLRIGARPRKSPVAYQAAHLQKLT